MADGVRLDPESYVSMNMWAFPANEDEDPAFLTVLDKMCIRDRSRTSSRCL